MVSFFLLVIVLQDVLSFRVFLFTYLEFDSIHQNNNIKVIKIKVIMNLSSVGREWFH